MKHVDLVERFKSLSKEVELGFDPQQAAREVQRCLNCDVQTKFTDKQCIECDACIDVCPVLCLTITPNADEAELRQQTTVPALNKGQSLFASGPLPQTRRIMVKDEDLCVHCGLCAERCPTGAWDMQKLELKIPKAVDTALLAKAGQSNVANGANGVNGQQAVPAAAVAAGK
jgi:ferredoxin